MLCDQLGASRRLFGWLGLMQHAGRCELEPANYEFERTAPSLRAGMGALEVSLRLRRGFRRAAAQLNVMLRHEVT